MPIMIKIETENAIVTYKCRSCGSTNIVRNGTNRCGNAQYRCNSCAVHRVLEPKTRQNKKIDSTKEKVLKACLERCSLRGVARIFNVSRHTIMGWVVAYVATLPTLLQTLLPATDDDVLELDEMWSFVQKKAEKRWVWTAMCRRTRQIVAYAIGDHSEKSCQQLWDSIPSRYKDKHCYSDFWQAYQAVIPSEQHTAVGKRSGETNHMERWYGTVRQWMGRYTRKTLSFSKKDEYHTLFTRWFIIEHNLRMAASLT